jgi:sigma-B regulation protein RsbU (phosphoserine phosphatase)
VADRNREFAATLDSLRPIGLWLRDAARDIGLPYEVAFGLDLAVHEAVENVVRHGQRREGVPHRVRLGICGDGKRVEVVITDDASEFDPRSMPTPVAPLRIEDVIPGGQGIHLMRQFTDEMHYRREGDRNVLTLVRVLAPRAEGA